MKTIWDLALHILNTLPWWLAAFLVGWIGAIGITQPLKVAMRRWSRIDPDDRAVVSWATAVLSGLAFAAAYAVEQGASLSAVLMVAVLTGIWSPLAFAGLQGFLRASPELGKRKGFGWLPDLTGVANWLSGDHGPSKTGGDNAR